MAFQAMNFSSKPRFTNANAKHGQLQGKSLNSQGNSADNLTDRNSSSNQQNDDLTVDASKEAGSIYGGVVSSVKPVLETPVNSQDNFTPPAPETAANTENWSKSVHTVLDQPPSDLPYKLIVGGMVFCIAFGAWATFGKIEEVGQARGQLVPKGEVYKINPVESGKVAMIRVKEGQAVQAGQVLFELDTKIAANEVERLQQILEADKIQLSQRELIINRTRLEAQTRAAVADADIQAQEAAIAQAKIKAASVRDMLNQLRTEASASTARVATLKPLAAINQELLAQRQADVAAYKARLERLKPLEKEGAIAKENLFEAEQAIRDRILAITRSKLEEDTSTREQLFQAEQNLRDRQRAITQSQGEVQQALAEANRLQAELMQKQAQKRSTQLEAQQQIQQLEIEMTQLKAKIAENKNLLSSAKAKLVQNYLYAPVNGVVSSLNVRNIGEVVQAGQTIAEMAPQNAPLVLSAILANEQAGFVKTGMPVQIKLDAYPYQDYGIVPGKVISISPDAKPDQRLGAVYRVEVELARNYVTANNQTINFRPGQTASADIIIRRRRVADILLDPIRQLQKGGIAL